MGSSVFFKAQAEYDIQRIFLVFITKGVDKCYILAKMSNRKPIYGLIAPYTPYSNNLLDCFRACRMSCYPPLVLGVVGLFGRTAL